MPGGPPSSRPACEVHPRRPVRTVSRACVVLAMLAVLASACGDRHSPSLDDKLKDAGWVKDPVADEDQPSVSGISPNSCRRLYDLLGDQQRKPDMTAGFSDSGKSLLWVKAWSQKGGGPDPTTMRREAERCPTMRMKYESATIVYAIRVDQASPRTTVLHLTATDDSGARVSDMLVAGALKGMESRFIRLVNSRRLTAAERRAFMTSVRYETSLT